MSRRYLPKCRESSGKGKEELGDRVGPGLPLMCVLSRSPACNGALYTAALEMMSCPYHQLCLGCCPQPAKLHRTDSITSCGLAPRNHRHE